MAQAGGGAPQAKSRCVGDKLLLKSVCLVDFFLMLFYHLVQ
jgi:hypothetical protein